MGWVPYSLAQTTGTNIRMNSRGKNPKSPFILTKTRVRQNTSNGRLGTLFTQTKSKEVWTLGWAKTGINVIAQRKTSPEHQDNEW